MELSALSYYFVYLLEYNVKISHNSNRNIIKMIKTQKILENKLLDANIFYYIELQI